MAEEYVYLWQPLADPVTVLHTDNSIRPFYLNVNQIRPDGGPVRLKKIVLWHGLSVDAEADVKSGIYLNRGWFDDPMPLCGPGKGYDHYTDPATPRHYTEEEFSGGRNWVTIPNPGSYFTLLAQCGTTNGRPDLEYAHTVRLYYERPDDAQPFVLPPSVPLQWGNGADVLVPGDYQGKGRADLVVYRPSDQTWYGRDVVTGATWGYRWGNEGDVPVPGDYDGDGITEIAVFRPTTGDWYVRYAKTAIPWEMRPV